MSEKGFTLLELLAVITIVGTIIAIALPIYYQYIEQAEADVCNRNKVQLERDFGVYLLFGDRKKLGFG
ncbi:type II secretion system protein [Bacillus kwashiorkori]|uniref:type II secretion system protein n=1 Tax=Bacillus kwashiorkori TaxID=1522318 RepID=UPI000780D0F1|nr:prepilin-type N-terminal cleavage/methylation domain-containing protein [Bacillus kwashiorkori]